MSTAPVPATWKQALKRVPYGLYVVGAPDGDGVHVIVANWVTQVSFHPPQIAVAIESDSLLRKCIEASRAFSVNLLPERGTMLAKAFLKGPRSQGGTINGKGYDRAANGSPLLKDAVATLACRLVSDLPSGDHVVFIGEVVEGVNRGEGGVLTLKETGWQYSR